MISSTCTSTVLLGVLGDHPLDGVFGDRIVTQYPWVTHLVSSPSDGSPHLSKNRGYIDTDIDDLR